MHFGFQGNTPLFQCSDAEVRRLPKQVPKLGTERLPLSSGWCVVDRLSFRAFRAVSLLSGCPGPTTLQKITAYHG